MKDLNKLFEDAKNILDSLGIPYSHRISVTINSRAKSRWGCSKMKVIRGRHYYTLEISNRLMEDSVPYDSALETMVHELLHCHFKHRGHTGDWKRYANVINKHYPNLNISRCASAAELGVAEDVMKSEIKYVITCDGCGLTWKYRKHSKIVKLVETQPGRCKCSRCGSTRLHAERCL